MYRKLEKHSRLLQKKFNKGRSYNFRKHYGLLSFKLDTNSFRLVQFHFIFIAMLCRRLLAGY